MTIKNTKKNISDEEGIVIIDVNKNTLTINNTTKNFNNAFELIFGFQDWQNEDAWEKRENNETYNNDSSYKWDKNTNSYLKKLSLPTNELVRLAHLQQDYFNKTYIQEHYYDKDEVDQKIKIHFYVWETTTPPTVAQIKALVTNGTIPSFDNYIFLVPYSTNYNNDDSDETFQEGVYREFTYVKKGNTESMEEIGSIKLDLRPYLKIANLDTELTNLSEVENSGYKTLVDQVTQNKIDIIKKVDKIQSNANHFVVTNGSKNISTQEKIGNIKIDGALYSDSTKQKDKILKTNSSTGVIEGTDYLTTAKIRSASNLTGQITATANTTTQDSINSSINNKLATLNNNFSNYLKLNDIKKEIWGEVANRMAAKQNQTSAPTNTYKLGDFIDYLLYDSGDFYTAENVDDIIEDTITDVINIQNNTLGML